MDRGIEFCFFQGIHVRTNIRTDISISMGTKFSNLVHLGELAQIVQIKQVLVTSLHQHDAAN